MPLARTMDKLGPMARGVEDCALVYHAIRDAGVPFAWEPARERKDVRVGIYEPGFEEIKNDEQKKLAGRAVEALRAALGEMRPVVMPPAERYRGLARVTIGAESASSFSELLSSGRVRELKQQEAGSWPNAFRIGATVSAADYLRAMQLRTMLLREMAEAMKDVDVFVTLPFAGPVLSYTNLSGHPSLVLRCGMASGSPMQIELIGQLYREDLLLHVGHVLERAVVEKAQWPDTGKIPELKE
jgi:Asp-tRNA(Asn)/Glu-tRNA(Gln) amidotransferase A subunit family amidase